MHHMSGVMWLAVMVLSKDKQGTIQGIPFPEVLDDLLIHRGDIIEAYNSSF